MQKFSLTTKRNSRRPFSSVGARIALVAVLCIIAVSLILFVPKTLGRLSAYIATPFMMFRNVADTTGNFVDEIFSGTRKNISERDRLRDLLAASEAERARLNAEQADLERFRALFGDTEEDRIVAGVLLRPNATPYDTLLVDKGYDDGVVESAYVYGDANSIIGSVIRTYSHSALVELYSSPGVESRVFVNGPDVGARAVGEGGGIVKITLPQGAALSVGDSVIAPTVPPHIFGEIVSVQNDPSLPDVYGYSALPRGMQSLRFVSIGRFASEKIGEDEFREAVGNASSTRAVLDIVPVESAADEREDDSSQ